MPPKTVTDKQVLITGAASGIGRATAIAAAGKGAHLFLTDINDEALQALAAELGDRVRYAKALNIADHDAVKAMADEIHAAHGSLDVVMNVAGHRGVGDRRRRCRTSSGVAASTST